MKSCKRMLWKQQFQDEDTGEILIIERSQIIEIEGEKTDGIRRLKDLMYE